MKRYILGIAAWAVYALLGVALQGCRQTATVPKPIGFARLELPAHRYQSLSTGQVPFTFEYPVYGQLNTSRLKQGFLDINFPSLGCKWHITYRDFLREHISPAAAYEDYRKVVYHHSEKASEISELPLRTLAGRGTYYELYGEVPTSAQFFFTDGKRNALMASFYFDTALKNDSLAPVIDFMKQDLHHLVKTLQWEQPTP